MNLLHILILLHCHYQIHWSRFLFKYTDLGKSLNNPVHPEEFILGFTKNYINASRLTRWLFKWFFGHLVPSHFLDMFHDLAKILDAANNLSVSNLKFVLKSFAPITAAKMLANYPNSSFSNLAATITNLKPKYKAVINDCKFPLELVMVKELIQQHDLYDAVTLCLFANHPSLFLYPDLMLHLAHYKIFNDKNLTTILNHPHIAKLSYFISIWFKQKFELTQALFEKVAYFDDLVSLNNVCSKLQEQHALNPDTLISLIHFPQLRNLNNIIDLPVIANDISPELINTLTSQRYAFLLSTEAIIRFWNGFIEERIQLNLATILTCRSLAELLTLSANDHEQNENQLNPTQSTHTTSVHQSASESAKQFHQHYAAQISETTLEAIVKLIDELDDCHKKHVIQKALQLMINTKRDYVDPYSGVSSKQLLCLMFIAIHDDKYRLGSLDDGLRCLLDALYEIQRGLSFERNDTEDAPICSSSRFNKLIEKLVGVHPFAQIIYLTDEVAGLRLQKVVPLEAFYYLLTKSSPQTNLEFQYFVALMLQLDNEGLDCIFESIKTKITGHFLPDFAPLYLDKDTQKLNSHFNRLIAVAKDLSLFDEQKTTLKRQVLQSKGYHDYCQKNLAPLAIFSLWSRRHDHPIAQHAFDSRYGLIIRLIKDAG